MRGTGAGNPALGRHFTTRKLGLLMCVAVLISVIFVDQGVAVAKKLRPTPVVSGMGYLNGIGLDSLGNLFAVSEGLVRVLPKDSGSLYGVSVTKGVLTPLPIHGGFNCAVDSAGNLFVRNDQMSVPHLTVLPNREEQLRHRLRPMSLAASNQTPTLDQLRTLPLTRLETSTSGGQLPASRCYRRATGCSLACP